MTAILVAYHTAKTSLLGSSAEEAGMSHHSSSVPNMPEKTHCTGVRVGHQEML